jgi:hypothetical protein
MKTSGSEDFAIRENGIFVDKAQAQQLVLPIIIEVRLQERLIG